MTEGSQQALRRTMEIYSKTTRFALACNASDKIIGKWYVSAFCKSLYIIPLLLILSPPPEPIQSRCAVLRYSRLSDAQLLTRMLEVCGREKVSTQYLAPTLYTHVVLTGSPYWWWLGGNHLHCTRRHETGSTSVATWSVHGGCCTSVMS